jgi:uncharacterized protein
MAPSTEDFQVFVKPAGSLCNLACRYCYYFGKGSNDRQEPAAMSDSVLERYIEQHIDASSGPEVRFSWHGGEPIILGLDYFKKIVAIQHKHQRPGKTITNGIQTNGTLLNDEWCRFFAEERFSVGISIDGPVDLHDTFRITKGGAPSHEQVLRGFQLLQHYDIPCDILCVVHAGNVLHPLRVYNFFKGIGARYIGFLPMVERGDNGCGVSENTIPAEAYGEFLCAVFNEWQTEDIGFIRVQIFEEALATALGREHGLCIFRKTCGDIPVLERNGDFFSCDHFVNEEHRIGNILETPLLELLENPRQRSFGQAKRDILPGYCKNCDFLPMCNGGCPKDRFLHTPDGEDGLNYLCAGYRRFFAHITPFATQVAALSRIANTGPETEYHAVRPGLSAKMSPVVKIGRNDPCPCGSGRKYKKCCMGK